MENWLCENRKKSVLRGLQSIVAMMALLGSDAQLASGQEDNVAVPQEMRRGGPPGQGRPSGEGGPPGEKKPDAASGEKSGEKSADKPGAVESPKPVERETTPPTPPNREEFEVAPDEDGKIQFNFRNQPWPDLLRWLARASNMSLDWQQLPGDYVNLATTRPFSVVETRDLVNRLLLLRGYTILEIDDVLMVVKTEGINQALVPYVDSEKLADLPPNRFIRTSFTLRSLIAEEMAEELKGLMSNNGKLIPLSTTNRLEGMDAAGVLSQIARLLNEEQSASVLNQLAREFPLEYVRASEVKEQLEVFLGQKKSAMPDFSDPRAMQQFQQQMQQMMQQGGRGGGNPNDAKSNKPERSKDVYLVANSRQNSVIVHAPPDKMAIIGSFIDRIDVPNNAADDFQMLQSKMKVYRLSSLDPQQLVTTLLAMDALEPTTRLDVDAKNKAVIAYASLADQFAIGKVIERLDGSARQFDVLQLRRLMAVEVAGTIKFLMGVEPEKEEDNNDRYSYYFSSRRETKKETNTDTFRVGANAADNQLLIWANEKEREEINKLLVKLGELPPSGGFTSNYRVIEASRSAETLQYLKELQERWSQMSGNPLILPDESEFRDARTAKDEDAKDESTKPEGDEKSDDSTLRNQDGEPKSKEPAEKSAKKRIIFQQSPPAEDVVHEQPQKADVAANESDSNTRSEEPVKKPKTPLSAVRIELDANGNLVLRSDDPQALNMLEELMLQRSPPKRPYVVFDIKNTNASWIVLNLKDYFKDTEDEKKDTGRRYYFYDSEPKAEKVDPQLGTQAKLKFVYDDDTNTVIVRNADEKQIELISELIELWDTPAKSNDRDLRYTKLVHIEYSKAEAVVNTIKDAYRDLLSSNDKAFQQGSSGGGNGEAKRDSSDEDVVRNGAVNFAFDGKLSLGIESVTNSVLVSAQGRSLLDLIVKMIDELDQAAKPSGSMSVIKIPSGANSESMQRALQAIMAGAKINSSANGQNNDGQNQNNQNNNNNNNDRGQNGGGNRRNGR